LYYFLVFLRCKNLFGFFICSFLQTFCPLDFRNLHSVNFRLVLMPFIIVLYNCSPFLYYLYPKSSPLS
jgi:hypothetical protein